MPLRYYAALAVGLAQGANILLRVGNSVLGHCNQRARRHGVDASRGLGLSALAGRATGITEGI